MKKLLVVLLFFLVVTVGVLAATGEWYDSCPGPQTCDPWPTYEAQPTLTDEPEPTCRLTPTCPPQPSTPTPYPTSTPYPTQPPWETAEPTDTPIPTPTATATSGTSPLPTPTPTATSETSPVETPTPQVGQALYGVAWVSVDDLPDMAAMNVNLVSARVATPGEALAFLDAAWSRGIKVIIRLAGSGEWGWDGSVFDLSRLVVLDVLVGDHPALLAVYGLHEPWERYTVTELQLFYTQWHLAGDIPLWHDLGHLRASFAPGIVDYAGIAIYPHLYGTGCVPENDFDKARGKLASTAFYATADPSAVMCAGLQVFGRTCSDFPAWRFPEAGDMRANAALVFDEFGFTCGMWYPYRHSSYDSVLSGPGFVAQREAVAEIYEEHFQ